MEVLETADDELMIPEPYDVLVEIRDLLIEQDRRQQQVMEAVAGLVAAAGPILERVQAEGVMALLTPGGGAPGGFFGAALPAPEPADGS